MAYDEFEDTFEATAQFDVTGSSFVEEVAYDADEYELLVLLNSARGYLYKNVPPSVFRAFKEAHSKGQYYNNWIKRSGYGPATEVAWDTEIVDKAPSRSFIPATSVTISQGTPSLNISNVTFPLADGPVEEFTYSHKVDYTVGNNAYSTTVEASKGVFDGINKVVENLEALGLDYEIKGVYVTVND